MAQEKVKPAAADGYFRPYDFRSFKPGNTSVLYQMPGYGVVKVSMKQHRRPVLLDCHTHVSVFMEVGSLMHQMEHGPGKEKLPEPAGVRKIGPYVFTVNSAFYNKPVGSASENPFLEGLEKFHEGMFSYSSLIKTSAISLRG
jgi:hypothetical protein